MRRSGRDQAIHVYVTLFLDGRWVKCDPTDEHRSGRLVDAVGASMSIPGFAPPISADDGRLLVDGAVLDNLLVDVMAAAGEGPVLAADVTGHDQLGRAGSRPACWRR